MSGEPSVASQLYTAQQELRAERSKLAASEADVAALGRRLAAVAPPSALKGASRLVSDLIRLVDQLAVESGCMVCGVGVEATTLVPDPMVDVARVDPAEPLAGQFRLRVQFHGRLLCDGCVAKL